MLASFSSGKAICELPKLDIFMPEDDISAMVAKAQDRDTMQLTDVGHDTYRSQLGSVAAVVDGAAETAESNPCSLLALMDEESDEV